MEFAQARVEKVGSQLHASHGDDKNLYVEFEMLAVEQPFASEQAGRPIYKEVPYITIHFPGDQTKKVVRPVKEKTDAASPSDPDRFPKQWGQFQNQQTQVQDGTPLEQWPVLNRADVKNLKALNIHTVESLSAVSDQNLAVIGLGGRLLRDKAVAWLKSASGNADLSRLISENEQLRSDFEALKAQFSGVPIPPAAATTQVPQTAAAKTAPARRGRKPKEATK